MDDLRDYVADVIKEMSKGELSTWVDPGDPIDISGTLTTAEINFIKRLKKDMEERFNPL